MNACTLGAKRQYCQWNAIPACGTHERDTSAGILEKQRVEYRLGTPGADECPGAAAVSQAQCALAGATVSPAGWMERQFELQSGSWTSKPEGCSLHHGDYVAHFNTNARGRDARVLNTGGLRMETHGL